MSTTDTPRNGLAVAYNHITEAIRALEDLPQSPPLDQALNVLYIQMLTIDLWSKRPQPNLTERDRTETGADYTTVMRLLNAAGVQDPAIRNRLAAAQGEIVFIANGGKG